jgi:hypothetical protein
MSAWLYMRSYTAQYSVRCSCMLKGVMEKGRRVRHKARDLQNCGLQIWRMLVHSLDLTPDSDDLMDSFDEPFLTCMLFELYLHVYLHLCTSHMARRKTASCHAKATIHLALVEAAVASDTPLATFQVGRGLHQRAVSFFSRPCIRIYTSTHLQTRHTTRF